MPATYSVNIGQPTEASRKPTVFSVLQDLPNNTQKLISPKDVRDAFLSSWANSSFRVTTPGVLSTTEYIGIDSGNPSNRDIKNKIFIGKRSFGNLDIMTNTLLNSDTDIFFFNTKEDTATQSSTKISILAGSNSTLYPTAPYIESVVNSTNNGINFNIKNPSIYDGPINIYSLSGRVGINGIAFPTVAETNANVAEGYILRYFGTYPNGYLQWDLPTVSISSIGVTGIPTNIYGSTVSVNGYPIEFIEDSIVPFDVGGVTQGASFPPNSFFNGTSYQNWPIIEVLRDILYPYIEPNLQLSSDVNNTGMTYAEVGTTPSITLTYSVTHYARESSEYISSFLITSSQSVVEGTTFSGVPALSFTGSPGSVFTGTATVATYSNITNKTFNFWSYVSNNGTTSPVGFPFGFSYSAQTTMSFISPVVSAFISGTQISFNLQLPSNTTTRDSVAAIVYGQTVSVNKKLVPYPGLSGSAFIGPTGIGYLYFMIPATPEYNSGVLSQIKDPNGYIVHDHQSFSFSAFTYSSTIIPSVPFDYYSQYRVYRTVATCSYNGSGQFELIFT